MTVQNVNPNESKLKVMFEQISSVWKQRFFITKLLISHCGHGRNGKN